MFDRSVTEAPPKSELSIQGATITAPPPPLERIFYTDLDLEPFSDPERGAPLKGYDTLHFHPDIQETVFPLKRTLAKCALNHIDNLLDSCRNGYDMTLVAAEFRSLPIVPHGDRVRIATAIKSSPYAEYATKVSIESAIDPVLNNGKFAGKDKITITGTSELEEDAKYGKVGRLLGRSATYSIVREWRESTGEEKLTLSPLHQKASSQVKKFKKTGTETYILPEEYESSVRIIPVAAANAWLAAFENWPAWFKAGFNYVPIEPIQSIHPTDDSSQVAVVTTNLPGRSYHRSIRYYKEHERQLSNAMATINEVIWNDMRVSHGHSHANNFVIVPYQNEQNAPDKSRCPRLYMIDFDAAKQYPLQRGITGRFAP